MKQVSIIIVTYNSEKDIYDCITSIKENADIPKEDIELIIVDNCSSDPDTMFAKLKELWGDDIKLIKNSCNGGYGQGNNVGIREATAPIILIINPDVRLLQPLFSRPLHAFNTQSNLIMYGMKQMISPTKSSRTSYWFTTMMNGYIRTILNGICIRLDIYLPRWMYFSGSCFFIRKSMFESIGLFDESVFMYGEEDDIHYRLMKRYGPYFHYDSSLRYLHLIQNRPPSSLYEKKLLDVDIQQKTKKGMTACQVLNTHLQINTTLIARCYIQKCFGLCDANILTVLKQHRKYIKSELKALNNPDK